MLRVLRRYDLSRRARRLKDLAAEVDQKMADVRARRRARRLDEFKQRAGYMRRLFQAIAYQEPSVGAR